VRSGRVIAVEPLSSAMECLEANLALNQLDHVTAVRSAIGRAEGTLEMVVRPGAEVIAHDATFEVSFLARLVTALHRKCEHLSVPTVSLGQLMDEHELPAINFLKVDCEGGEYEMLRNIGPSHWPRIERIALEYHEFRSDHDRRELVAILRDNGFRVDVRTGWVEHLAKCGAIWATRDSWEVRAR
jgi:FkbM family methyltransferase